MPCKSVRDEDGTLFRVPAYEPKSGQGFPCVDVWWRRDPKNPSDETLTIRQENGERADVLSLTLGQAYDLLHAIASAINKP